MQAAPDDTDGLRSLYHEAMRVLLQRVTHGSVRVDQKPIAQIGQGVVLLVGIGQGDAAAAVDRMALKITQLRVFRDQTGRLNQSLIDTGGGALVVSQFTLYANTRRGRRPSFTEAAPPEAAEPLVDRFASRLSELGVTPVATGVFGASMAVEIHNDGPVTIWLDSATWTSG